MPYFYYPLSAFINATTSILLGSFVLSRNIKAPTNRSFAYFAFSVGFWSCFYFLWQISTDATKALFWCRVLMAGAIFIPSSFLHFCINLIDKRKEYLKTIILGYLGSVIFLILDFTPLYIPNVKPRLIFPFWPTAGVAYAPFLAMFIGLTFYAHVLLFKEYRQASGFKRHQILYVFLGTAIGFIGGTTNYPLWYDINILPIGNILVSVYVASVAYAIIRHHLMDIEVLIKKTLVFASLFTIVFGIFVTITLLIQQFIGGGNNFLGFAISSLVIIFTVRPLETFLINITDKYLFQKKYDPRQVIRSFIDYVATVLDLDKIVGGTIELLEKIFHPKVISILLPTGNKDKYVSYGEKDELKILSVENSSQILKYLKSTKGILSIESVNDKKISEDIRREMLGLKIALAVPLILQDELIGIMLLDKKKSDEYYTQEDLSILMDLARTLGIALKNAEFIKERDAMHMEMMQAKLKEELATMADGMSHQFNNKFQGISSAIRFAKQMLMQNDITSQNRENLKEVFDIMTQAEDTALAAGDIATGLLNFTRPKRVQYEMVNIAGNINVALQLVEYKHKDFNQIEVAKNIEEKLPLTYAHLGYFQEIYFITIDNAYDAIKYRMYDEPNLKGRIEISASSDKKTKEIIISIADNGSGMKPNVLENVRNAIPYFTTKGSSGKSGYGAGTQVLRRLVDFHKGKITYDSTYGKGTTLTMRIPIAQKPKDSDLTEEGKTNG